MGKIPHKDPSQEPLHHHTTLTLCLFFFFRKVMIMEDPDQNIHLRNLSLQQSANEEEALNLLFLGDTNRMIAEVRKKSMHEMTSTFSLSHYACSILSKDCWQQAKIPLTTPRISGMKGIFFIHKCNIYSKRYLKTLLKYYFGPLWSLLPCFSPVKPSILSVISVYVVVFFFFTHSPRLHTLMRYVVGQLLGCNLRFGA